MRANGRASAHTPNTRHDRHAARAQIYMIDSADRNRAEETAEELVRRANARHARGAFAARRVPSTVS